MNSDQQYAVCAGSPLRLGAMRHRGGVNFSLNVRGTETVEVLLYREGEEEPFQAVAFRRITGPDRFTPHMCPLRRMCQLNTTTGSTGGMRRSVREGLPSFSEIGRTEAFRCGLDPEYTPKTEPLGLRYRDCIFYKVHVRGFTNGENAGVRHPVPLPV
jgi:pullulanase/glycogen debranching enzyme